MSVGDASFLLQQNDELLVVNSTMGTAFTGFSHFKDPPVNRTEKIVEGFIAGLALLHCCCGVVRVVAVAKAPPAPARR
ncbi:hypothetical protein MPL3365_70161 [Mesorhizobium plurifarium]|uniref:Uncharacterized protein n=1 Tax=Mesorhizobium plurifarium TaxID=69974 RepID=A0A090GC72_MESPL|nr:hypothetical protein MPL3365_70161 [Mesorhizobium plurifarium]